MITFDDGSAGEPRQQTKHAGWCRRLERAWIALSLAVLLTILFLVLIGIIPLWMIFGMSQ